MSILLDKKSLLSVSISCLTWSWANPRAVGGTPEPDQLIITEAMEFSSTVITMGWTSRRP